MLMQAERAGAGLRQIELRLLVEARQGLALEQRVQDVDADRRRVSGRPSTAASALACARAVTDPRPNRAENTPGTVLRAVT